MMSSSQSTQDQLLRLLQELDMTPRLIGVTEPAELIQLLLEAVFRLFQVEACSIALLNEGSEELSFAYTLGGAKIEEVRIPLGQGIIGWVVEHREGVVSNDPSNDSRFLSTVDRQTGFRTKTVLCAPLSAGEKVIGAIEALNTTAVGGFRDDALALLTAFGDMVAPAIERTRGFTTLRNTKDALQETVQGRYTLVGGTSGTMKEALTMARNVATANTTVLLLGESGTGKEVFARTVHQWSPRANAPFVAVNCVALTPELLESELFGHEKGAFTGAVAQKKGKFELAAGGTIFLDEIGDMTANLQVKLLRVLQEREFQRVGGETDIQVDVRIIAATNRELRRAMQDGSFREDLYYRLSVVPIQLPPLRERKEEIADLVSHFLDRYCQELTRPRLEMEAATLEALKRYPWPGNVRELQNVIERLVVLCTGPTITPADLPRDIREPALQPERGEASSSYADLPLALAVEAFKRDKIRQALAMTGNKTQAAKLLGIPRSNLSRMMKTLGLRD